MSFTVNTDSSSDSTSDTSEDKLILWMSEDAYRGDALFNLYIDGVKIGGSYKVTASHAEGDLQKIEIDGDFSEGDHQIGVEFINDRYGGDLTKDRNLYVHSAEYAGQTYDISADLRRHQTATLTVSTKSDDSSSSDAETGGTGSGDTSNDNAGGDTTGDSGDSSTTSGKLVLWMSEDAYAGDAQFKLYIDGEQVGSTYKVTSSHAKGDLQKIEIDVDLGQGSHQVNIDFINDASGKSSGEDRNLYFQSAEYDGKVYDIATEMAYNQTKSFTITSGDAATSYDLKSMRAADFIDLIGINQHATYLDTAYGDKDAIVSALDYLGIHYIRTSVSDAEMPFLKTLAAHGVEFDVIIDNNVNDWSEQLANIHELAGHIKTIEGPNEVNYWPVTYDGATGVDGAIATQEALYEAVNTSSDLKDIPVASFSVAASTSAAFAAYANDYEDLSNAHVYFGGTAPGDVLAEYASMPSDAMNDGKTTLVTESGYNTGSGSMGVSESVQAKYTLDLVLDAAKQGVAGLLLYELADLFDRPAEEGSNWGLFDSDWNPKPAAQALHNLTTILADSGSKAESFATDSFAFALKGMPASGESLVLEKSSGAHDIAIWAEPSLWNTTSHSEIASIESTVEVDLDRSYATVKVFDPLESSAAIQTYHNVDHLKIGISDHPLIVEVA